MAKSSISITPTEVSIFGHSFKPTQHLDGALLFRMFGSAIPLDIQKNPSAAVVANYLIEIGERALQDCLNDGTN